LAPSSSGNAESDSVVPPVVRNSCEANALYYLTGWLAFKLKRELSSCCACASFLSANTNTEINEAQLVSFKCFGGLTRPSDLLKNFIFKAEDIFSSLVTDALTSPNVQEFFLSKSRLLLELPDIPKCHDVGTKLLVRFFKLRSHIRCKGINKAHANEVQHGSKSAKARCVVK